MIVSAGIEASQDEGGWKRARRSEAGRVSKVGKQCEERADVDVGSTAGRAKARV